MNAPPVPPLQKGLKISGLLVGLGLLVESATLFWSHPTSFLAYLLVGGTLVGVGVLVYLYSIVSHS
jgi:hypothetical protein